MLTRVPVPLMLAVMTLSGACASSGESGGVSRSRDLITAEELAQVSNATLYEAVRSLRPRWLQGRIVASLNNPEPQTPRVYVDGAQRGGLDEMRTMQTSEVQEIRFMNSRDATTRYGTGHVAGAILITTMRR